MFLFRVLVTDWPSIFSPKQISKHPWYSGNGILFISLVFQTNGRAPWRENKISKPHTFLSYIAGIEALCVRFKLKSTKAMRNRQYDMQQYRINEPTEVTGGLHKKSCHLVSRRLCIGCGELVVCFFVGQQKCAIALAPPLWPILSFASADHCDWTECITTSPDLTLVEWMNEWIVCLLPVLLSV